MGDKISSFAERLSHREPVIGTFVKTPSPVICEVLGLTGLQVCCLDAEHAPFGRFESDQCIAQLRAGDMPSLVRVPDESGTEIRNALDAGATGILVPHVTSAKQAQNIVRAAHFGEGGRGYAGSTRAADFTTRPMATHIRDSRNQTTIVLQIEDLAALPNVAEIAQVPGVHALFVGRVDLAVAMNKTVNDQAVISAVQEICRTVDRLNRAVGLFTPNVEEIGSWRKCGASFFLLGSDQGFVLQGAAQLVDAFSNQTS